MKMKERKETHLANKMLLVVQGVEEAACLSGAASFEEVSTDLQSRTLIRTGAFKPIKQKEALFVCFYQSLESAVVASSK